MVWFEIIPSLVITAAPLLLVAAPTIYVGNWFFLNGKVISAGSNFILMRNSAFCLEIWTKKYDER